MQEKDKDELKLLVKKRGVIKSKQTLFKTYLETAKQTKFKLDIQSTDKQVIIELQKRLDKYSELIGEFDDIQTQIELMSIDPMDQLEERAGFEDVLFELSAEAKGIIDSYFVMPITSDNIVSTNTPMLPNATSGIACGELPHQGLKLPPINLTKFSGEYKNWLEFRDLFDSLINSNVSLSNVQKFHYLRASLEGGAAQVIRGVETTDSNYHIAWNMLCTRYNNNNVLIQNHIKALVNLPHVTVESSVNFRVMFDSVSKHIQSLKTLKQTN